MVQPGRMLWYWKQNDPCGGSAIANLPAPLSPEEARRGCKGEKRSSYSTKCRAYPQGSHQIVSQQELPVCHL